MSKAGFWLKGARGKLGGSILSGSAGGDTIIKVQAASYHDRNSDAQVKQRSAFKLLSQLAANCKSIIAIPREGAKSPRNLFVSINRENVMTTDGVAQITLDNVQLTKSTLGFPQIVASRTSSAVSVHLGADASANWNRVCYIIMKKNSEGYLDKVASTIVNDAGQDGDFPATIQTTNATGNIVIYGYGMSDNSAAATAKYGNLTVQSADDLAKLFVTRQITASDATLSQTRGATMMPSDNSIEAVPEGSQRCYVTALGDGTVSGGGVKTVGSSVTVTATIGNQQGTTFTGWKKNGTSQILSTNLSYTFTMPDETVDLVAVFNTPSGDDGNGVD